MNPSLPAVARIPELLAKLEARSRHAPGLYPVSSAEDFFRLTLLHLGRPVSSLDAWEEGTPAEGESICRALADLAQNPAEASVWVNRILLREGQPGSDGVRLIPADARRTEPTPDRARLSSLLHPEITCPPTVVRSA